MTGRPEFDPRFDPAFQRGYEPPVRPQRTPPAPRREDLVGPPTTVEPQHTEEPQPLAESQPTQDPQRDVPADATTSPLALRRGINPYTVILWVVGVIFAVGGTALLFAGYLGVFTSYSAGSSQGSNAQALYVLGTTFGVPLVTVGLATIAGLIFFSAWHSRRRHDGSNS